MDTAGGFEPRRLAHRVRLSIAAGCGKTSANGSHRRGPYKPRSRAPGSIRRPGRRAPHHGDENRSTEPSRSRCSAGRACPTDSYPGTTGPDDPHEPYCKEICAVHGLCTEDLPWVTTYIDGKTVRLFLNAGLFVVRRSVRFGELYRESLRKVVRNWIALRQGDFVGEDQVAFSVAIVAAGLRYRVLPLHYNYPMMEDFSWLHDSGMVKDARLLHYHGSFWPYGWKTHLDRIAVDRPDLAEWLAGRGPLSNRSPRSYRLVQRLLKSYRDRQARKYLTSCRLF